MSKFFPLALATLVLSFSATAEAARYARPIHSGPLAPIEARALHQDKQQIKMARSLAYRDGVMTRAEQRRIQKLTGELVDNRSRFLLPGRVRR